MHRLGGLRVGRSSALLVVLLTVAVSLAVSLGAWHLLVGRHAQARDEAARQQLIAAMGLNRPVSNRLDARFADADGDLVADPPAADKLLDPPTLRFCYVAVDDEAAAEAFKTAWADFMRHLSEATGRPVEYLVLASEQEQLRALKDGRLHVTGFNTGRVPIAVNACGFVPVAMPAGPIGKGGGGEGGGGKGGGGEGGEGAGGEGKTHTEIIVPADSPIRALTDLKNRELTLTDPGSNSGYKAPLVFLKDYALLPGRDYLIRYSGSHEASIRGIAERQYQAAAVAADVLRRAEGAGAISPGQYRTIFKSERFPTAGIGYAYNLKPELARQVRQALLKLDWAGTSMETFFAVSGQDRLVPVNYKDDWPLVRRIDDAIGYEHVVK